MAPKKKCFVPNCINSEDNKVMLSVPRNLDRRKVWFEAVGIPLSKVVKTAKYACEDHFELEIDAENWMYFKTAGERLRLTESAVPRISEPKTPTRSQLTGSAKKRKAETLRSIKKSVVKRRCIHVNNPSEADVSFEEVLAFPIAGCSSTETAEVIMEDAFMQQSASMCSGTSSLVVIPEVTLEGVGYSESVVAVRSPSPTNVPISLSPTTVHDSASIKTLQPILTGSTVATLGSDDVASSSSEIKIMKKAAEKRQAFSERCRLQMGLIETNSRFYLGVPESQLMAVTHLAQKCSMCVRDVYVVLKKIRTNDSNRRLGDDFGISVGHVSKIFVNGLPKVSKQLKELVFWPDAHHIQYTMPLQFRHRFWGVQSIIDCFEIEIEKPSDPKFQALTWSEYKKCNTMKVLISCTPVGFVNYISPAYGGRISDKNIVLKSGYLEVVPSVCEVLADRAFKQVDGILAERGVTLIRPSSVSQGQKPTSQEVRDSKRISSVRIHIERVISRIREFHFLGPHARVDNHLVPLLDDAVIIAAGIINLQKPIIK